MRGLTGSPRRLVQLVAPEVGRFVARASVASPPVIELETPRRLANSRAVNTAEGGPGGKQRQTLARAPLCGPASGPRVITDSPVSHQMKRTRPVASLC